MTKYELEGIVKYFEGWVDLGICPDCGGDLDENDECPGWYSEEPNSPYNLTKLVESEEEVIR